MKEEKLKNVNEESNKIVEKSLKFEKLFEVVFKDGLKECRKKLKNKVYVSEFYEYPILDHFFEESLMPSFKTSFLNINDEKFKDYSSLFCKYVENNEDKINIGKLCGIEELIYFIENDKILKEKFLISDNKFKYSVLYLYISDFLGRYIYKYGTKFNRHVYVKMLFPVLSYLFFTRVDVLMIFPILLTRFKFNTFKINEDTKIIRMNEKTQLSRYNIGKSVGDYEKIVKGCATHALCIKGYYMEFSKYDNYFSISRNLGNYKSFPINKINSFFITLFLVTGIYNGYAQTISIPHEWELFKPDGDLIEMYGTSINMYPRSLEDGAWNNKTIEITEQQLKQIKRIYNKIINCKNKSIEMAVDRLIRALIRDEKEDAFLDILIGIEILLTDDERSEVSYKLGMRISAIIGKKNKGINYKKVLMELYKYRSAIVHGKNDKQNLSHSKILNRDCYDIALEIFSSLLYEIISNNKLLYCDNIAREIDQDIMNKI